MNRISAVVIATQMQTMTAKEIASLPAKTLRTIAKRFLALREKQVDAKTLAFALKQVERNLYIANVRAMELEDRLRYIKRIHEANEAERKLLLTGYR